MKTIVRMLKAVFDFFCGDWRIFWGVTATTVLVAFIERLAGLEWARPAAGAIFILGISSGLLIALRREIAWHTPATGPGCDYIVSDKTSAYPA